MLQSTYKSGRNGGNMRYIEGINRKSKIAFPEYIDDYITEDNPVKIIDAFVESLDFVELDFTNSAPSDKGRPGYNPADLTKLYIYGYMNKITSSRRLEKATQTNIEVMWLLRRLTPDFKTIAEFRKNNKEAINLVFKQFVTLCKEWDLFGKEMVAIDGSKFRAVNSKKNNFNAKNLNRKIKYLDEKIQKYMTETEENDTKESVDRKPDEEEIKEKIQKLRKRKQKYEGYKKEIEEGDITEISTTDPDSRLMAVNNNGIDVCHNVQIAVDSKHKLIVDLDVTSNPTDHGALSKLAISAKETFEVEELKALADKGCYNAEDLIKCEEENIITYVPKQQFDGHFEVYLYSIVCINFDFIIFVFNKQPTEIKISFWYFIADHCKFFGYDFLSFFIRNIICDRDKQTNMGTVLLFESFIKPSLYRSYEW
jgi:transposase